MKHKLTKYQMKIWIKNMGKGNKELPVPGKVLYLSFPNHIDPDKKFAAIRRKGKNSYMLSFTTERPIKKSDKPVAVVEKKEKKTKKEKTDRQTEGWIKVIRNKKTKPHSDKKNKKNTASPKKVIKASKPDKKKGKRK